jgi:hypothetical protein
MGHGYVDLNLLLSAHISIKEYTNSLSNEL